MLPASEPIAEGAIPGLSREQELELIENGRFVWDGRLYVSQALLDQLGLPTDLSESITRAIDTTDWRTAKKPIHYLWRAARRIHERLFGYLPQPTISLMPYLDTDFYNPTVQARILEEAGVGRDPKGVASGEVREQRRYWDGRPVLKPEEMDPTERLVFKLRNQGQTRNEILEGATSVEDKRSRQAAYRRLTMKTKKGSAWRAA
jgi:hypothetical protein